MDSGSLIPSNGQNIREFRPDFPLELNRPVAPAYSCACPRRTPRCANISAFWQAQVGGPHLCCSHLRSWLLLATLRSTRIYEAAGSIAINKPDPDPEFQGSQNGGVSYEDPTDLDTEVSILKSDLLALQVMGELNWTNGRNLAAVATFYFNGLAARRLTTRFGKMTCLLGGFKGRSECYPGTEHANHRNPLPQP